MPHLSEYPKHRQDLQQYWSEVSNESDHFYLTAPHHFLSTFFTESNYDCSVSDSKLQTLKASNLVIQGNMHTAPLTRSFQWNRKIELSLAKNHQPAEIWSWLVKGSHEIVLQDVPYQHSCRHFQCNLEQKRWLALIHDFLFQPEYINNRNIENVN